MRMSDAIGMYLRDMRAEGRINSDRSERTYYDLLALHAVDVSNRDPRTTSRDDVKRTLRRWANPNTQATRRATMVSFYDWAMEEGYRKDNPARQTRRPRKRPTTVYRLQLGEARRMMLAAEPGLETRAIYLGLCAGLRSAELLGLQPRHFSRPGYVWVSKDIGKGGKERYVPITVDLEPIVEDIVENVHGDEYVLCAQHFGLHGQPAEYVRTFDPTRQMGATTIFKLVRRVAERAGIVGNVGPHTLRHAFCDHIARTTGDLRLAQSLMGHADVSTTRGYTGAPTLDELTSGVAQVSYLNDPSGYPPRGGADIPAVETVGIEPTHPPNRDGATRGIEHHTPHGGGDS